MKITLEYLKDNHPKIYTLASEYTRTSLDVLVITNLDMLLSSAFTFTRTFEGNSFWDKVRQGKFIEAYKELDKQRKALTSLPNNFVPIDDVEGFPIPILNKMMDYQKEQFGKKDITVFENSRFAGKGQEGFVWTKTKEGRDFWVEVIEKRDFDVYFKKYPEGLDTKQEYPLTPEECHKKSNSSLVTKINGKKHIVTADNILDICAKKYPLGTVYKCARSPAKDKSRANFEPRFVSISEDIDEISVEVGIGFCFYKGKFAEIVGTWNSKYNLKKGDILVSLQDITPDTRLKNDIVEITEILPNGLKYSSVSKKKGFCDFIGNYTFEYNFRLATKEEADYYHAFKDNDTSGGPNTEHLKKISRDTPITPKVAIVDPNRHGGFDFNSNGYVHPKPPIHSIPRPVLEAVNPYEPRVKLEDYTKESTSSQSKKEKKKKKENTDLITIEVKSRVRKK